MGLLSPDQSAALRRDARQFNSTYAGGLPALLDDLDAQVSAGNIGITAQAWDVDALALGSGNFAQNEGTTVGLTLGHRGGRTFNGLANIVVAAGTLVLTASSTNYVEVSAAGVVSANTTAFTSGRLPLWTIVTGVSSIATIARSAPVYMCIGTGGIIGALLSSAAKTKEVVIPLETVSATAAFRIIAPSFATRLVKARLVVETTVAADNTNFWTFDLVNRGAAGVGTTPMLIASDANTTKTTGGSGITGDVARTLSLHGTVGNLDAAADNVLRFTATKAAAAANLVSAWLALDFSFEA